MSVEVDYDILVVRDVDFVQVAREDDLDGIFAGFERGLEFFLGGHDNRALFIGLCNERGGVGRVGNYGFDCRSPAVEGEVDGAVGRLLRRRAGPDRGCALFETLGGFGRLHYPSDGEAFGVVLFEHPDAVADFDQPVSGGRIERGAVGNRHIHAVGGDRGEVVVGGDFKGIFERALDRILAKVEERRDLCAACGGVDERPLAGLVGREGVAALAGEFQRGGLVLGVGGRDGCRESIGIFVQGPSGAGVGDGLDVGGGLDFARSGGEVEAHRCAVGGDDDIFVFSLALPFIAGLGRGSGAFRRREPGDGDRAVRVGVGETPLAAGGRREFKEAFAALGVYDGGFKSILGILAQSDDCRAAAVGGEPAGAGIGESLGRFIPGESAGAALEVKGDGRGFRRDYGRYGFAALFLLRAVAFDGEPGDGLLAAGLVHELPESGGRGGEREVTFARLVLDGCGRDRAALGDGDGGGASGGLGPGGAGIGERTDVLVESGAARTSGEIQRNRARNLGEISRKGGPDETGCNQRRNGMK